MDVTQRAETIGGIAGVVTKGTPPTIMTGVAYSMSFDEILQRAILIFTAVWWVWILSKEARKTWAERKQSRAEKRCQNRRRDDA